MRVAVVISPNLVKITRSPIYVIISSLTGVSMSFAPLFLYWSGKGKFFPGYEWVTVPLCFALSFFVPLFYIGLGSAVARELRRDPK
jgi:hypothetical protein